jgi:HAMP domain-containing protein
MKLRTKIFLSAVFLVFIINISSFLLLNYRFSNIVKETTIAHLNETGAVFMKIIEDRQTFLGLLSENIAESPRMKAAASVMDAPTLDEELREIAQINQRIDLGNFTNPDLEVMSYLIGGERQDTTLLIPAFQEYVENIENNPSLTDVWLVDESLYQIAGSIIRSGPKIHELLLIGDRVDDELANTLKEMTDSDVSFIVNRSVLGSTIDECERLLLLQAFGNINRLQFSGVSSDPSQIVSDFTLNDENNQYSLGSFPGYPPAQYIVSRPNDSEAAVLDELRVIFIYVGIIAAVLVFLLSLFVARRLTQPLNVLIERSQDIASGNYTHEISNVNTQHRTNDEIFLLAHNFEQMRCSIRDNIEKVTNLNTELFDKNSELEQALDDLKKALCRL